jgi:hypothetical protein
VRQIARAAEQAIEQAMLRAASKIGADSAMVVIAGMPSFVWRSGGALAPEAESVRNAEGTNSRPMPTFAN